MRRPPSRLPLSPTEPCDTPREAPEVVTPPPRESKRVSRLWTATRFSTRPPRGWTLERLAPAARATFGTLVVLLNLITVARQWSKAFVGADTQEVHRLLGFCTWVVASDEPLVVTDATRDARFWRSTFVTSESGIRLYAGTSAARPDGHGIGTKPREHPSGEPFGALRDLVHATLLAVRPEEAGASA